MLPRARGVLATIKECCRTINDYFLRDELAYLCMTGIVEREFQAKLAFLLHKSLADGSCLVRRELNVRKKRVDIAVISKGEISLAPENFLALVELKAGFGFDIYLADHPRHLRKALQGMKNDAEKLAKIGNDKTTRILIFLAPYVKNLKDFDAQQRKNHEGAFQSLYKDYLLNPAYVPFNPHERFHEIFSTEFRRLFSNSIPIGLPLPVNCGKFFEFDVELLVWIIELL